MSTIGDVQSALTRAPVIASLTSDALIPRFVSSQTLVGILAATSLAHLPAAVRMLTGSGKLPLVNVDTTPGLGKDKGALDFLREIDVPGVITTRVSLVERARALGMLAVQKVFVTDRSTLPRSVEAARQARGHFVELMPWPIIARIDPELLIHFSPYIAAGFVASAADVRTALDGGASAVATSDPALWLPMARPRAGTS